jgi:protein-disulfide isomerase
MNKSILISLVVLVVVAVGAGGWFYLSGKDIGADGGSGAGDASEKAPAVPEVAPDEKFLGNADAPVTIVEYFSLGCIHCKNFHENLLPRLKADYIDTGKARIVYRDFPLDGVSLAAASLTRCVSDLAYFAMVDALFQQQKTWYVENGVDQIRAIAKGAGLDDATFDACLNNQAVKDKIIASRQEGETKFQVNSTPTFIINDRKVSGVGEYEAFKATIDNALAAKQ